jgi:hypothetical protein
MFPIHLSRLVVFNGFRMSFVSDDNVNLIAFNDAFYSGAGLRLITPLRS